MDNINSTEINKPKGLNLKEELFKYLFYWKWFAAAIIVFVLGAYLYLRKTPEKYQSNALIQVLDTSSGGIELPTAGFVFKRSNINLENEISAITSYAIVEKLVQQLHLNYTYFAKGTIETTEVSYFPLSIKQKDTIPNNQYGTYTINFNDKAMSVITNSDKTISFNSYNTNQHKNLPFDINNHSDVSANYLSGKTYIINATSIKNKVIALKNSIKVAKKSDRSDLLTITLTGQNPKRIKTIINTLIEIYKQEGITERQQISKSTIDFIDKRFEYLITDLDSAETLKEYYKKNNKIVDVKQGGIFDLQSLSEIDKQYYSVSTQLEIVKGISNDLVNTSDIKPIPLSISEDEKLNNLIAEYNKQVSDYKDIAVNAGENNLSLKNAKDKLNNYRANIVNTLRGYQKDLEYRKSRTQSQKNRYASSVRAFPNQEKQSRKIERELSIKETLYLFLLQKKEEAGLNFAIAKPNIKVLDYALTNNYPITPRPKIIYAIAIALGLLIPFAIIYVKSILDTKVHTRDDVFKVNPDISVIGEVPSIKNKQKTIFRDPNSNNVLAEAFRILSSNLNYMLPKNDDAKVILSTSTIKGEGKTFVSINLSLALSSLNKKVLLIGADLRNPQIHKEINTDKNNVGLSNYLYQDDFDWHTALIKGFEKHKHHHILLSGTIPPNPSHILTNGRLKQLIDEAKQEYDYIIIDSAPTILVTDTLLISNYVDATVFVVRADYTEKKLLNFSKDLNETNKLKNVGYVINDVGSKKSYGYSYGYNYGYGYGYTNEDEDED